MLSSRSPTTGALGVTQAGVVPPGVKPCAPLCIGDAPMAEQQTATCLECSRTISPGDTLVFGYGRLGHLVCRRPRVLSAEERTLLFLSTVGTTQSLSACPWCHTDLTDSIRAHLYGWALLPVHVRRR